MNSLSDRNDNEPCPLCKRVNGKTTKDKSNNRYDSLLREIEEGREELAILMKQLEELEDQDNSNSHEPIQQIFNVQNYKVLQKILEEAETGDDVLLFADQNRCTWQIINRKDLNSKGEINEQDMMAMEEIEDKNNKVIRGKNSLINVDKIESEYNTGNEKDEKVVIIEDLEKVGTEEKKDEN